MSMHLSPCHVLIAGVLAALLHSSALAARPAVPLARMAEVTSLAGLPAQIRADLGVGETDAISDRGGPFNPGCVMVSGRPNQRFMLAALGADRAVVATEQGGIFHGAISREYRYANGKWTLVSTGMPGLHLAGQDDLLAQHVRSAQRVGGKGP